MIVCCLTMLTIAQCEDEREKRNNINVQVQRCEDVLLWAERHCLTRHHHLSINDNVTTYNERSKRSINQVQYPGPEDDDEEAEEEEGNEEAE